MLRNTDSRYGTVARSLHWLIALLMTGLFASGWYMTELTYYDPWYQKAPALHKAIGLVTLLLAVARIGWALYDRAPPLVESLKPWEQRSERAGHLALYLMSVLIPVSGYLISTAKGDGVSVFGWFEVPALLPPIERMEDVAGTIHYLLAFGTAYLVLVHLLAALKHEFLDRDGTLGRMWGSHRT